MDLGMTERVRPLVEAVRDMVRDEIAPLSAEASLMSCGILRQKSMPLKRDSTGLLSLRFSLLPPATPGDGPATSRPHANSMTRPEPATGRKA